MGRKSKNVQIDFIVDIIVIKAYCALLLLAIWETWSSKQNHPFSNVDRRLLSDLFKINRKYCRKSLIASYWWFFYWLRANSPIFELFIVYLWTWTYLLEHCWCKLFRLSLPRNETYIEQCNKEKCGRHPLKNLKKLLHTNFKRSIFEYIFPIITHGKVKTLLGLSDDKEQCFVVILMN